MPPQPEAAFLPTHHYTNDLASPESIAPHPESSFSSNGAGDGVTASSRPAWTLPTVPWGLDTTITVMALWIVCFWLAAYSFVPAMLLVLGIDAHAQAATSAVHALRHLVLDVTQLGITLVLLQRALREHSPRKLGLFTVQLAPLRQWVPTVIAGVAVFPVIDWVHKQMVALLAAGPSVAGGSSGGGSLVSSSNWEARALWFIVLALCAPVWEEVMFRGFLLPSLARRMPSPAAVAASSVVFALVHFTREGFLPLLLLGGVFGAAYLHNGNLVPAIVLHSLWNVCLLVQILVTGGAV